MRILLAAPGMSVGGAERVVVDLARGLAARGHEVIVSGPAGPLDAELGDEVIVSGSAGPLDAEPGRGRIVSGPGGPLDAELRTERVLLREAGRSLAGAADSVARLARQIRRRRPTIVHGHNVKATAVAGAAARLARGPRRPPVVATFHGVAPGEYRAAARLLRAADRVACVSEDLAAELERAGLPAARLLVIGNAVAAAAPAGDGIVAGTSAPLVVAVGRLVPQKNHERLLLAARRVRERGVPASFAIVGGGPLLERLTARAAELGLGDVVRFTGVRPDARAIMTHADLVAFSSDWEGLSIAALEALAAGTPVVSTPAHGMRELLGDGAVAASMDAIELGDLIADVLGDPDRRAAMGAAGRRLVAERYSSEAMVDAYERLYRQALSARG